MTDDHIVERIRTEIIKLRAAEVGGCFRPDNVPQGECSDGDCYCFRQCGREARAAWDAAKAVLDEAGIQLAQATE